MDTIYVPALAAPYNGPGWVGDDDPSSGGLSVDINDLWLATMSAPAPVPGVVRGAVTLGTASYDIPTTGAVYYVDPASGSDSGAGSAGAPFATAGHAISTLLSASGGTVILRGGTYHESITTATSSNAVTVQNYPGEAVWFDGSVAVTSWTASGSTWVHTGVPTQFSRANGGTGFTPANYLGTDSCAALADQVFIDGTPLTQIADGATPAAGQFSVNYDANTITIGSTPVGHQVRVTDLGAACVASAPVSWKGIGFRRYSPATFTTTAVLFYGGSSQNAILENIIVDYAASTCVSPSAGMTIHRCTFTNSMWRCVSAPSCDGLVIDSCIMQGNNRGLFVPPPQTGVIKISLTVGVTITNNLLADNNGANGIWCDVTCTNPTVVNNRVSGSHNTGMQFEETSGDLISGVRSRGVVAGNFVTDCAIGLTSWVSSFIDFYNNTFDNNTTQDIYHAQDRSNGANGSAAQPQENSRSGITSGAALTFVGGVPTTSDRCPYWAISCTYANNVFSTGSAIIDPFRADDKGLSNTSYSAVEMDVRLLNNTFRKTGSGVQIQWGNTSGVSPWYDPYSSVTTAQSTVNDTAHLSGNVQSAAITHSQALPIPGNIAALLGVASGTQHMGSYLADTAPSGGAVQIALVGDSTTIGFVG